MSGPVPSPSMKGRTGWSGTCRIWLRRTIFSPAEAWTLADSMHAPLRLELCAECRDALQAILDCFLTARVREPDTTVVAERDARDRGHLFFIQQLRAEVGGVQAEARDVRENIECPLRL